MISIIIPIYNHADKLSRCLDSILKQSYKDYEVIIVNDGSTDNVEEVFERYKQNFNLSTLIFQLITQENNGANSARNRGHKEASGEYLLFCDADIEMEPEMLEIMLKTLESNPKASFTYSSFKYGFKTFKLGPYDAKKLKQMPYIHSTSLIRKEHFLGWDEKIKRLQDWDLWLTMLEQGHTGFWVDKILFKVSTGGTMSSWLPSFVYKLFPFLSSVKKYNNAVQIIKEKHKL
jgi:glycosyltransferase involved in cell wall biosynthesis